MKRLAGECGSGRKVSSQFQREFEACQAAKARGEDPYKNRSNVR